MTEIIITFKISSFDFAFIWSVFSKEGGKFNEFLVNNYIEEIAENFPKVESVIPRIYLTSGNRIGLLRILCGAFSTNLREKNEYFAKQLENKFFVSKKEIVNGINVGI